MDDPTTMPAGDDAPDMPVDTGSDDAAATDAPATDVPATDVPADTSTDEEKEEAAPEGTEAPVAGTEETPAAGEESGEEDQSEKPAE